jgi:hypothetical protein
MSSMTLSEYCELLAIEKAHVDVEALTSARIATRLKEDGFAIGHDIIDESAIRKMRAVWTSLRAADRRLGADLVFGQVNYSHRFYGRYTRHFEFYWNDSRDMLTRSISLLLHYARNVVTGHHPLYGLVFSPARTGIYLAVTHYPPESGEMAVHIDLNYFLPVHFNVPLSFKGKDYAEGGLMIHQGNRAFDVDQAVRPGSVVLFNGSVPHLVQRIRGAGTETSLGRLQLFAIPTKFHQKSTRGFVHALAQETYGRLRYLLYRYSIGIHADGKNFR